MIRSKITGIGGYVPPQKITNDDLSKMIDTNDEWIVKRTGIKTRYWAKGGPEESTSNLALHAVNEALSQAKIDKSQIDMIIFATLSPDYFMPGSAGILQSLMDIPGIPALDIRQQCTGFIYGLEIADAYIRSGMYKKVLLVGAETQSLGLNKTDVGRDTAVLFGDGAGAVIIEATEIAAVSEPHIIHTRTYADGSQAKDLWVPAPGSAVHPDRINREIMDQGLHHPQMNGKRVFVNAISRMCESLTTVLQTAKINIQDVDLFFFHQANLRINMKVAEMLEIPEHKVFNTIEDFGNTTAATIPLGMKVAKDQGVLKNNMLIASAAFGSGYTWGASVWRY